mmetsp:Transcript_21949/g.62524  ORF Transcript_21949/g.62524 Transcript_21949/m.62524 type:complete len:199 (-) Transcript_21949:1402-1998(-)
MLQYDNSAFYFFALSFITLYLVPSWISIIGRLYDALFITDEKLGAITRTSAEKAKADKLKRERKGIANLMKSRAFVFNFILTVVLTVVFVWLATSVASDGQVNSFDPFSILEIDSGSDAKAIKKAYRSLSLKYHPDKNPGDRAAEARFMMISKAYEALTDETARENWENSAIQTGSSRSRSASACPTSFWTPETATSS